MHSPVMVGIFRVALRPWVALLLGVMLLSACEVPVDTLDDVELAEDAPQTNVAAEPDGGGIFGNLFARTVDALPPLPADIVRPMARGQDADADAQEPQGLFARLARPDPQETEEVEVAAAAEPEAGEGFFARLARRNAERAAAEAAAAEAQPADAGPDPALDLDHPLAALRPNARGAQEPEAPQGFFARLAARNREVAAAQAAEAEAKANSAKPEPEVEVAALAEPEDTASDAGSNRGLFGRRQPAEAIELPGFGEMTPVCGLPRRSLGTQVARYPETGRVRYAVYDTVPGQAAPRLMYVTGFEDGCPRQIWAALALFGSFEMHEQVRYLLPARAKPYSATDKAYEELKSEECGVDTREPCGSKMRSLARDGVFLSLYEKLGRGAWTNILIHDGEVLAVEGS